MEHSHRTAAAISWATLLQEGCAAFPSCNPAHWLLSCAVTCMPALGGQQFAPSQGKVGHSKAAHPSICSPLSDRLLDLEMCLYCTQSHMVSKCGADELNKKAFLIQNNRGF